MSLTKVTSDMATYTAPWSGGQQNTVLTKLEQVVCVLDFIPESEHAAIRAHNTTNPYNCTTAFVNAFAACKRVYCPQGTYSATIDMQSHCQIYGDGPGNALTPYAVTAIIPVAGAAYAIGINAVTTAKQYCVLENLQISNPNSVSNCIGIYIQGTDVNSIDDLHVFRNLEVKGFEYGQRITGRMIGTTWEKVFTTQCGDGFKATVDAVNAAFIFNYFINCTWNLNRRSGHRVEGANVTNYYNTCNFQSNTLAAGMAASYFYNSQNLHLVNCYWENNGSGISISTTNPYANAIDLHLAGVSLCDDIIIQGCLINNAGTNVLIDSTVVRGGKLELCNLNAPSGGFAFVLATQPTQGETQQQFCLSANNTIGAGQVLLKLAANTESIGYIEQSKGNVFWSSSTPPNIDLLRVSNYTINNASPMTLTAPINSFPGCQLYIYAGSTGTVTMPAANMVSNSNEVIAAGTGKLFRAMGYPWFGKFVIG